MRISAAITAALLAGVLCFAHSDSLQMCSVSLRLIDGSTGRETSGLVHITAPDGHAIQPVELLSRGLGISLAASESSAIRGWSVLNRPTKIRLRPGRYMFEAISGLETETSRQSLELTAGRDVRCDLRVVRFSEVRSHGWFSGNTHLHLARISREDADRYLEEVPRADGLDLLFVSYLERAGADQDYVSNSYRLAELVEIGRRAGVRFGNGEEHRHNFDAGGEGYGHVMFLNLKSLIQPVSIGPGITKAGTDGIPLERGIDLARRQTASVIWCHNDWGRERIPSLVSGRLDAQNIFDGSIRSGYRESFYRDLNAGFRTPFSTGTDWFIYDFSRVYVRVQGEPTVKNWLESLAAGRTFITNGPLLDFSVDGRGPGDVLRCTKPGSVRVEGRAVGRVDFGQIELVRNGSVIVTASCRRTGGHYEAAISRDLSVDSPCWLALRTPPPPLDGAPRTQPPFAKNELGKHVFAHTSAVHVEFAGRRYFDGQAARSMLADMRASRDLIARTGRFADNQERARVLDVYADGINALKKHIAQWEH